MVSGTDGSSANVTIGINKIITAVRIDTNVFVLAFFITSSPISFDVGFVGHTLRHVPEQRSNGPVLALATVQDKHSDQPWEAGAR